MFVILRSTEQVEGNSWSSDWNGPRPATHLTLYNLYIRAI